MSGLPVAEKEHWKQRIEVRIEKRIEALKAQSPGHWEQIKRSAKERALESLGLTDLQSELDDVVARRAALDERERQLERGMLARVRRVDVKDVDDCYYHGHVEQEVKQAIAKRAALHEDELMAEDDVGRDVLKLRAEKENLLDVVWLATSPKQIRELWCKVAELLGEAPSRLEREALAIEPIAGS
jgi:hypothetical protein